MILYRIHIPLFDNDGLSLDKEILKFEESVIEEAGGFTKYKAIGRWKSYVDEQYVYLVDSFHEIDFSKWKDILRQEALWVIKTKGEQQHEKY